METEIEVPFEVLELEVLELEVLELEVPDPEGVEGFVPVVFPEDPPEDEDPEVWALPRAAQVACPTTPSTSSLCCFWKLRTAF